jgi:hypothetical protein
MASRQNDGRGTSLLPAISGKLPLHLSEGMWTLSESDDFIPRTRTLSFGKLAPCLLTIFARSADTFASSYWILQVM